MERKDSIMPKGINILLQKMNDCFGERRTSLIVQFVKFGLVGISNSVISYSVNIIVLLGLKQFDLSLDYMFANIVAFFVSVLWSFYWNNRFVFTLEDGKKRNIGIALLKTYITYAFTGIILNNVLSYVWITIVGISKYMAPLINIIISVPINFLMNKCWAFKANN